MLEINTTETESWDLTSTKQELQFPKTLILFPSSFYTKSNPNPNFKSPHIFNLQYNFQPPHTIFNLYHNFQPSQKLIFQIAISSLHYNFQPAHIMYNLYIPF